MDGNKPFLDQLKKQANDDAIGADQVDVTTFLTALDAIIANPKITPKQLLGKVETLSWKGGFVRGFREVGISSAKLLGTGIPR